MASESSPVSLTFGFWGGSFDGENAMRRELSPLVMEKALFYPVASMDVFQDDLPSISISRLRATGAITAEMSKTKITIGGVEVEVGLQLVKFPNGGSWSFALCPHCGLRARVLKLFDGCVLCWRCCCRRGAQYRVKRCWVRGRAELRIPRLKAMLEASTPLRLKPVLWGTMERRKRHEAALVRCEFILSKGPRYRDVLKQTPELEPEPIAEPRIKATRKR